MRIETMYNRKLSSLNILVSYTDFYSFHGHCIITCIKHKLYIHTHDFIINMYIYISINYTKKYLIMFLDITLVKETTCTCTYM